MLDWVRDHPLLLTGLFVGSVVMFVGSLIAMPMIVARIPADYFAHARRPPSKLAARRPVLRLALRGLKNVLGAVLLGAGIAMLVLPGQGILTIVVGFFLLDLPGKYPLERWLVGRRWVGRPINWLRRRRGRDELVVLDRAA